MRRTWLFLIALLILVLGSYLFIFSWLIPRAAMLTLPLKWRNIPLRQSKTIARAYFGEPAKKDSSAINISDQWNAGSIGKAYQLRIDYTDTAVTGYSIHYLYSNGLIKKNYLIDTFSIK